MEKDLQELFKEVCLDKNGTIELSFTGCTNGGYHDGSYATDEEYCRLEGRIHYDTVMTLFDRTCSDLNDYPDDGVEWVIKKDGVKVTTIGHGAWDRINSGTEEEDEEEDTNEVYNFTIKEFNSIYQLVD